MTQLVGNNDQIEKDQNLQKDSRHPQVVSHMNRVL